MAWPGQLHYCTWNYHVFLSKVLLIMTVWQDLGFKSKWGKFFTLNMLTTRHGENYRFKTASNQNCEVEHTFENQCRLYKCENNDSNMILTEKIEMEEKSWGSKSKNRMRQTQWWHISRSFATLHARDYTLHVQAFPHLNVSPSPYPNPSILQAVLPSFKKKFCFFKIFFLMWTIFKVFIEFVTVSCLFYVLVFWPWGIWDFSSPTRA